MTGIEGRARKAQEREALKPNFNELQRIEADYDPDKDYDDDRIEWLMATARRAMRDKV